ncbi:MAG: hypothetical protein ACYTGZ_16940 [Planctomycetota bacterium]|jgi:hypothetical protein
MDNLEELLANVPMDPASVHAQLRDDAPTRDRLRKIATGETETEHLLTRQKALTALEWDEGDRTGALDTLRQVMNEPGDSRLRIQAIRSLARAGRPADLPHLQLLVRNRRERPEVALAAARALAKLGGREMVPDLRRLRRRLMRIAGGRDVPSLHSLDEAIRELVRKRRRGGNR